MSRFWSDAAHRSEPYVPGEQLEDIIKLNTNENPYPPSPLVIEAIQNAAADRLHLYPSPVADSLRKEIANRFHLKSENVFAGNGSDEVLAFSFLAFFDKHREIRYPAISYSFYPVYAKLFGVPTREIALNEDFSLPVEALFQSDGGVIFPNPNAPTSIFLKLESVRRVLENNPDSVVIVDEAYIDFAEESAVSLIPEYENLLVIQTMSKSRSLAGLRVGFALGHPDLIEGLNRIKDSFNSYTLDRLALAGAEAAMKDETYFKETTEKIIAVREWTMKELKRRNFTVLESQANFVFCSHPKIGGQQLYSSLKEKGVLVRHFNKPEIDQYIRVSIGTQENMHMFFKALDDTLSAT